MTTKKLPSSEMIYITSDRDRLDQIVFNHYGQNPNRFIEIVLEANRGLAEKGVLFESGVKIIMPFIGEPQTVEPTRLFN